MTTRIIVLAAGKGTRMNSTLPKVLHCLAGKPLLEHVLDTTSELNPASTHVVIGHGAEQVKAAIDRSVHWALQAEQLGTGHAVQQGLTGIEEDDTVLITYGDVPLTRASTFKALVDASGAEAIALLTLIMEDPSGYGRVIREAGQVAGVVEQRDASKDQLAIREVNCGVLALSGGCLRRLLAQIDNNNSQGEYYLTDIFALAVRSGISINTVHPNDAWEVDGVNSRAQLARLERIHQNTLAHELMESGVTLQDPQRIDIRGSLTTGTDVQIDVNCIFEGACSLGNNVSIGANCLIKNSHLADDCEVLANSVIDSATMGEGCSIGPFARVRPGTRLDRNVRIGNFVETKNAQIGDGSKISHLSYIGDADIGKAVNVGAGTITCNYDGANKHKTVIEDRVFIGSNSSLIAPVVIGEGATVGAGSTIARTVPADGLSLTRAKQTDIKGWQRPAKKN